MPRKEIHANGLLLCTVLAALDAPLIAALEGFLGEEG